jgi:sigma-B regulation protein RsbU (phosphoserine phosphatase)
MEGRIVVLLIDEQPMVGEGVRRMLTSRTDIAYHFCRQPDEALATALRVKPTAILLEVSMLQADGFELARSLSAHPATAEIPLLVLTTKEDPAVKAEAFAAGANDYIIKLPDRAELIARLLYHSKGYLHLLERNAAYEALAKSEAALQRELQEAARYVRSLLPPPLEGHIRTRWSFITSASLGGDALDYRWLDHAHFSFCLLDVCGHGVGAALLSVAAIHALRGQTPTPELDRREPGAVLRALNEEFPMEKHNDMYFAAWYGVFDARNRRLAYSSGGHPPALLLAPGGEGRLPTLLRTANLPVGSMPGTGFESASVEIPPGSTLYLFSDGVFELSKRGGGQGSFQEFIQMLTEHSEDGTDDLERLQNFARSRLGASEFEDDFSILRIDFA